MREFATVILLVVVVGGFNDVRADVGTASYTFLPAQNLKDNLNSDDPLKLGAAISYVAGIADYLAADEQLCPPEDATILDAAILVREDLNRDPNRYDTLSAVVPTRYALIMAWGCE